MITKLGGAAAASDSAMTLGSSISTNRIQNAGLKRSKLLYGG